MRNLEGHAGENLSCSVDCQMILARVALRFSAVSLGNGVWRLLSYGLLPIAAALVDVECAAAGWEMMSLPLPDFLKDLASQAQMMLGGEVAGEVSHPLAGAARVLDDETFEVMQWRAAA